jgi:hypothetical protein
MMRNQLKFGRLLDLLENSRQFLNIPAALPRADGAAGAFPEQFALRPMAQRNTNADNRARHDRIRPSHDVTSGETE